MCNDRRAMKRQPKQQTLWIISFFPNIYKRDVQSFSVFLDRYMDARTALSSAKHYIHTPMPLFQYLCSLDISRAHEHVFLLHWCEGQIRGDWKSRITIERVAEKLSLSQSTVKRAYRELAALGLIRRYSQGRNSYNPMRSDVTITEVTIPDAVAKELMSSRDRGAAMVPQESINPATEVPEVPARAKRRPAYEALHDEHEVRTEFGAPDDRRAVRNIAVGASAIARPAERTVAAVRAEDCHLDERGQCRTADTPASEEGADRGRISSWFAIKLRRALRERLDESKVDKPWHQMLWSIGYGSLSEQPLKKAFNVVMKLLRMNRWMTPWDMPDGWQWGGA